MAQQQPVVENKRFGMYLRRIREERRLSLDTVEELSLGLPERVTKSHLSRIENGKSVPTFPRMFTLSQIYGVPVAYLAERFELCLKLGMFPKEVEDLPVEEVKQNAAKLRTAGRHAEALLLYEGLLERADVPEDARPRYSVDLRLECINCLVKLAREASAKEECERLLGSPWLSPRQKVVTLQYLAICCYRLSKFTVAMMAIDKAEHELKTLDGEDLLGAHLGVLKGNLMFVTRRFAEAADAFRDAMTRFESLGVAFEACRSKLNLASALIELGSRARAREHLNDVLQKSEAAGYDRQRAFALSHLGLLAYRDDDLEQAERMCLRSNRLAPREYVSILFRNCYYLWRIARLRKDDAATKTNERTLRAYLSKVEDYMPEAEDFRVFLGGGKSNG